MSGFLEVLRIELARHAVDEAYRHLREVGRLGHEGLALWVGKHFQTTFRVVATVIPPQTALASEEGVCVTVKGDALHDINRWLYRNQFTLIGQIHSHPGEAFHSRTDDTFSIATGLGSVSVVVPDFAKGEFSLPGSAIYRLEATHQWRRLLQSEVDRLLTITE